LLRDVFIWAYVHSCQQYLAVRQQLVPPDSFRLCHRPGDSFGLPAAYFSPMDTSTFIAPAAARFFTWNICNSVSLVNLPAGFRFEKAVMVFLRILFATPAYGTLFVLLGATGRLPGTKGRKAMCPSSRLCFPGW